MSMPNCYDLANPEPTAALDLFETFHDEEQKKRIAWMHGLSDPRQDRYAMDTLLHETGYKSSELKAEWTHFELQIRNAGAEGYRCAYRPTKNGVGRLWCANSINVLPTFVQHLILAPVASLCSMDLFKFRCVRWLAKEEGYACNNLNGFLADPKDWKEKAHLATSMTPKAIDKRLDSMWTCHTNDERFSKMKETKLYPDFASLHNEVQAIKAKLYENQKYKWAIPHCNQNNMPGSFMRTVLDAIETKIVHACVQHARGDWGWKVQAVTEEGIYPTGNFGNADGSAFGEEDEAKLRTFDNITKALCPGMEVQWVWKPLSTMTYNRKTGYELRDFAPPPNYIVPEEAPGVLEDDDDPDAAFSGNSRYEPDYFTVKQEFEEMRFKVNGQYVDHYTYANHEEPRMEIISEGKCRENWKHLAYSTGEIKYRNGKPVRDANGNLMRERKNHNFLARWLLDPKIEGFRAFANNPDADKVPEDCYNMWREYAIKQVMHWDRAKGRRIVIKYLDFVHKLLGSEKKQTVFFLKWQAHPFQHPGEKPTVMASLLGPQGGGKTSAIGVITDMMGKDQVYTTKDPDQNVYGKNGTTCIANKKFINVQEVKAEKVGPFISGLRPIITDDTIEVKGMGMNPINIESLHMVALTSNFLDAMSVDTEAERRFWVAYCTNYWVDYFKRTTSSDKEAADATHAFFAEFKMVDFLAEYHFFCTLLPDVPERFNGKYDVPIGKLQQVSRSTGEEWTLAFLRHLTEEEWYASGDDGEMQRIALMDGKVSLLNSFLAEKLGAWTRSRGWDKTPSMDSLGKKLSFMDVQYPGVARPGKVWVRRSSTLSGWLPAFEPDRVQPRGQPRISDAEWQIDGSREGESMRCWWVDLDILRRVLKSDVEVIRRMIRNREQYDACETKCRMVKKKLAESECAPMAAHVTIETVEANKAEAEALEQKLVELREEYQHLSRPEVEAEEEADDDFDAEAEYERVMRNHLPPVPTVVPTMVPTPVACKETSSCIEWEQQCEADDKSNGEEDGESDGKADDGGRSAEKRSLDEPLSASEPPAKKTSRTVPFVDTFGNQHSLCCVCSDCST